MTTTVTIKQHSVEVTSEQIGRCYKITDGNGRNGWWRVESESDDQVRYEVRWSKEHGYTCTCKAGQHGFAGCRKGFCKHIAWAVAAERELRDAMAEQVRLNAQPVVESVKTGKPVNNESFTELSARYEREMPAWMFSKRGAPGLTRPAGQ